MFTRFQNFIIQCRPRSIRGWSLTRVEDDNFFSFLLADSTLSTHSQLVYMHKFFKSPNLWLKFLGFFSYKQLVCRFHGNHRSAIFGSLTSFDPNVFSLKKNFGPFSVPDHQHVLHSNQGRSLKWINKFSDKQLICAFTFKLFLNNLFKVKTLVQKFLFTERFA